MSESNTSDHIQIKIKMPNPSQEPPVSVKAQNQNIKDMDVLCTLKIKIECQNFKHLCIKTSDHTQIMNKILNSSQEPPAPSKAPNQD